MLDGFKSIRKRFMFIGIISIFLFSAIYVFSSSYLTTDIVKDLISQDSSISLKSHANMIGNWLEERINEIEIYANHPTIKSRDVNDIHEFLITEQEKHHKKYLSLLFSDEEGNYQTNLYKEAGNIVDREYFSQVMKGQSVLSNPIIAQSMGKEICVVAAPIKDVQGEIVGLFGGTIDLNAFYSFVERLQVDTKYESTYIVDKAGEIIAHTNPNYIMKENIRQSSEKVSQEMQERAEEILSIQEGSFVINSNEGRRMVAFQQIPNTEGWRIVTEISLKSLYQPILKTRLALGAIGLALVLVGTVLAIVFAQKQSGPIVELTEVFERATAGDLEARANIKYKDEIGKAGRSFNMMMDRMNELTYYDALTGLPNKQSFMDRLNKELYKYKREQKSLSVMIISLNKFKQINEAYGHNIGDYVLAKIAKRLRKNIGPQDMVSRLLGDEFIAFFSSGRDRRSIVAKTTEILDSLSKVIIKEGHHIYASVSIGIAFSTEDGQEAKNLIENASIAKSTAKYSEGNTYKIYHRDMRERLKERVNLSIMLHSALENKEYFIVYQPLVDVRKNQIIGAEALLRWNSPHKGVISPGAFIPLLEESGLIVGVGEWVLREVCRQNKLWQDEGLMPMVISVNVSPIQFEREDFVDRVKEVLKETKLKAKYLQLEITEGIAMQNTADQLKKLHELRNMGVKIAIDDFGTGYSSLSYFKEFPVSSLKIDQSFVQDILKEGNDKAIISAIISMGHNLGLLTTAEGVETEEQLEFIKEQGCDNVQGYLFSKPITSEDFEKLIKYGKAIKPAILPMKL